MFTHEQVSYKLSLRIAQLEENLREAKTVEEVNQINFAIEELECIKLDFQR